MARKYFLPLNRLAFHFVDGLLCCAEAFLFDVAYFSFLIFVAFAFDVKSKKKIIANSDVKELTLCVFF